MHLSTCGLHMRLLLATILGTGLSACGSSEPIYPIPDYLSPKSKEVLASFQDIRICQVMGFAAVMNEVIGMSNPIEHATGTFGQSLGQGSFNEPGTDAAMAAAASMEICCREMHNRAKRHYTQHVLDGVREGTVSREENQFWRRFIGNANQESGRCRLPMPDAPPDRDRTWPTGRRS